MASQLPPTTVDERIRALEEELTALRTQFTDAPVRRSRLRGSRLRRALVTVATAIVIVTVPGFVLASDTFNDVPTGHTFHDEIGAIADAGITTGCGGGNYCPATNVNRGQMAAFMHRGYGRVAESNGFASAPNEVSGTYDAEALAITPGNETGGAGYLLVTGSASVTGSDGTPCPCTLRVTVVVDGVASAMDAWDVVEDTGGPFDGNTWRFGNAMVSDVFPVSTGVEHDVILRVTITRTASASVGIESSLTAVYIPFDGAGAAQISAVSGGTSGSSELDPLN